MEADIMVPDSEKKTELIEAAIGELSSFHDTHGCYAQGVDYSMSRLPEDRREMIVNVIEQRTICPISFN